MGAIVACDFVRGPSVDGKLFDVDVVWKVVLNGWA
jgi:hypothetical protein